jgi:hypothetical protein
MAARDATAASERKANADAMAARDAAAAAERNADIASIRVIVLEASLWTAILIQPDLKSKPRKPVLPYRS